MLDGFLVKPVTPQILLETVLAALQARQESTQQAIALPPPRVRTTGKQLSGVRILVVEDNLNNQQIARELLEDEGASITLAAQGRRPSTACEPARRGLIWC
ncbi:response regulator [Edwardsiella anguillarum]|nr:response regulator [Edwardsiella anguillarum]